MWKIPKESLDQSLQGLFEAYPLQLKEDEEAAYVYYNGKLAKTFGKMTPPELIKEGINEFLEELEKDAELRAKFKNVQSNES